MLGLLKRLSIPVAAVALCASAPLATASILAPGGSGAPDALTIGTFTILGSGSDNFSASSGSFQISGVIDYAVITDSNNTFGAGDLDFIYQVQQNSSANEDVATIAATAFNGYSTDVGVDTTHFFSGLGVGTVTSSSVQRNAGPGDVINFNFSGTPAGTTLGPSMTSYMLVIETNATAFTAGGVSAHDGAGTPVLTAFAPTTAPLPATAATGLALLAGLGVLGGVNVLRRRRQMA